MEPHDDRIGRCGQEYVRLRDGAHALSNDLYLHFFRRELLQRVRQRADRPVDVALYDDPELLDRPLHDLLVEILEGNAMLEASLALPLLLAALGTYLFRQAVVGDHGQHVTGLRNPVQSRDLHGLGRARLFDVLTSLVVERPDLPGNDAHDERISYT